MSSNLTINHVDSIVSELLQQVEAQIDRTALLLNIPAVTTLDVFTIIYSVTDLEKILPPQCTPLQEENIVEIAKLDKDTLMPKDLSQ